MADGETQSLTLDGVCVRLYHSDVKPGVVSIQIETNETEPGQKVRVMLNDADLFIGDPEKDDHPYARQVQEYYDNPLDEQKHRFYEEN